MKRRALLSAACAAAAAAALPAAARPDRPLLTPAQSRACRAWIVRLIALQLQAGPTPRWHQRDCAGLVRFAVAEALREHDAAWKRANGLAGQPVPPEVGLSADQQALRHAWHLPDGSRSAYAGAIAIVQGNASFRGKDCNLAQPGDLLFYDQGDAQHLMVWMGSFIAYHTGSAAAGDSGLRAVRLAELLRWNDTRWHPASDNPNFAGVYRLAFLTA